MWKDWKSGAFQKMSSAVQLLPTNPCMLQSSRAGGIKEQWDRDLLTEEKETEEECGNDAWVKFPPDNPFGSEDGCRHRAA